MKNLLLLLLLINLLVWGWYTWVETGPASKPARVVVKPAGQTTGQEPESKPQDAENAGKPLQLPANDAAGNKEESVAVAELVLPEPEPPQAVCKRIGPLTDKAKADKLAAALREDGFEVTEQQTEQEDWVGHWVKLAGFTNKQEARAAANRLKQAGITDLYTMENQGRWEVSLGIFKSKESADRIQAEAKAAGEPAIMVDRTRQTQVYNLTVKTDTAMLAVLQSRAANAAEVVCP